jgi:flagellar biosynthetic protein FliQ
MDTARVCPGGDLLNGPPAPDYFTFPRAVVERYRDVGRAMKEIASMDSQTAVDLARQALSTALLIGAPILLVGVVVGLLISLVQALTQIQDQTISFVPKIIAMLLVMVMCLPWLIQHMVTYSQDLITNIPHTLLGS